MFGEEPASMMVGGYFDSCLEPWLIMKLIFFAFIDLSLLIRDFHREQPCRHVETLER